MVIIVDREGAVKSVPASIPQGTSLHGVTIISPYTNASCVLKVKPANEEWIRETLSAAATTADNEGVVFTANLPDAVTETAGRAMYQLSFTYPSGEIIPTNVGSFTVSEGVPYDMPESAEDLSGYTLKEIYTLLSGISSDALITKRALSKMRTPSIRPLILPADEWLANKVTVLADGVTDDSVVLVTYDPEEASTYADAEIICIEKGEGYLSFSCENKPTVDISVTALIFNKVPLSESSGGGGGESGGGTGGTLPEAPTNKVAVPSIKIAGDILTISHGSGGVKAESFDIFALENQVMHTLAEGVTEITYNLCALLSGYDYGAYYISVTAKNETQGATPSQSNVVLYEYAAEVVDAPAFLGKPSISFNSVLPTMVEITPGEGNTVEITSYVLYVDGSQKLTTPLSSIDLSILSFDVGTYELTVKAYNETKGIYSEASDALTYKRGNKLNAPTINLVGNTLTITNNGGDVDADHYIVMTSGGTLGVYSTNTKTIDLRTELAQKGIAPSSELRVWVYAHNDDLNINSPSTPYVTYAYDAFIDAPRISLVNDRVTIFPGTANVKTDVYYIFVDGKRTAETVLTTYDLSVLQLTGGVHAVSFVAYNQEHDIYSASSNEVKYGVEVESFLDAPTVRLDGYTLYVSPGVGSTVDAEKYSIYAGTSWLADISVSEAEYKILSGIGSKNVGTYSIVVYAINETLGVESVPSAPISFKWEGYTLKITHTSEQGVGGYYWKGRYEPQFNENGQVTGYTGTIDVEENEGSYEPKVTTIKKLRANDVVCIGFGNLALGMIFSSITSRTMCSSQSYEYTDIDSDSPYKYFVVTGFNSTSSPIAEISTMARN